MMRVPLLLRLALPALLVGGLAGCVAGGAALDAELRTTVNTEVVRRPGDYTNGTARAWLVSKDGVERGLLWGTIHVGYSGDTILPAAIRARFYRAADLTVETLLDQAPRPAVLALRLRVARANAKDDPAAVQSLDAPTRKALNAALPGDVHGRSLRGLAMMVSAQADADPLASLPSNSFVDADLIGFARSQDRPVLGLEAPQLTDTTLDDPNGADAAGMLRQSLRRADMQRASSAWVLAAYGRGDLDSAIAALVAWRSDPADLARTDRERAALLTARTAAWVPGLERTLMQPGEHFVAVGAGHLVGQDGLVALLRRDGFEVLACPGDVCPVSSATAAPGRGED